MPSGQNTNVYLASRVRGQMQLARRSVHNMRRNNPGRGSDVHTETQASAQKVFSTTNLTQRTKAFIGVEARDSR